MIASLMGVTLYNFNLAASSNQVPTNIDSIGGRITALENLVANITKDTGIATGVGGCISYNSRYVSTKIYCI